MSQRSAACSRAISGSGDCLVRRGAGRLQVCRAVSAAGGCDGQGLDRGEERPRLRAEELAAKAGIPKGKVASFEIDRAWLLKAKGDTEHLKLALRALKSRKDLTDEQRAEGY